MKDTQKEEDFLSIGQVLRPQGLLGSVKVRPDTSDPGRFMDLEQVYINKREGGLVPVPVHDISLRGGFVYLTFDLDSDAKAAEERRDLFIYIKRGDAVALNEYENYISDMIGCDIRDTKGTLVGTLTDILQQGAADVYVVKTEQGTLMFPALKDVILQVDVPNKCITADEKRLSEVSVLED